MTLVKWRNRTVPSFSDVLENFFNDSGNLPAWNRNSVPAVNIRENKDDYQIDVAAPGLAKEDFNINVENDTLTISANKEVKREEEEEGFTRKEFGYTSFSRSFWLPETVSSDDISAKYQGGILHLTIPKKEEAKQKPARQIQVS